LFNTRLNIPKLEFNTPLRSVYTERDRKRGLAALVQIKQTKVVFRVRFRALYKRL